MPIGNPLMDRYRLKFIKDQLTYQLKRTKRIRMKESIYLPFTCWAAFGIQLTDLKVAEESLYGCG